MSSYIFDISMTRDSYSIIITWNELFLHGIAFIQWLTRRRPDRNVLV